MDDRIDDAVAASQIGDAGHGTRPPADLSKGPLDRVGRTDAPPVGCGEGVEGEQCFPIAQEGRGRPLGAVRRQASRHWCRARSAAVRVRA